MAGFGDNTTVFQRVVGTSGLRFECGAYTQATDATACIPSTFNNCVCGLAIADGSTVGVAAIGAVSNTIDFSIHGGGGTFSGKVVQYIAAGW